MTSWAVGVVGVGAQTGERRARPYFFLCSFVCCSMSAISSAFEHSPSGFPSPTTAAALRCTTYAPAACGLSSSGQPSSVGRRKARVTVTSSSLRIWSATAATAATRSLAFSARLPARVPSPFSIGGGLSTALGRQQLPEPRPSPSQAQSAACYYLVVMIRI
jgi:hypothetical protein